MGASHYFTGKPCKHGHVDLRHTRFGDCRTCKRLQLRQYRADNPAESYATTKRYRLRNPDTVRATRQRTYAGNRVHYLAAAKDRADTMRAALAEYARKWRKDNPGKVTAYTNARRCAAIQRTPEWTDLQPIVDFYANCPVGCEVDHALPLRGRNVSGFHTLANLQYLQAQDNRAKSNKFVATWPAVDFTEDLARAAKGLASFTTST